MFLKILKWASALLLLPTLFLQPSAGYALIMLLLVSVGAIMVAAQAFHARKVAVAIAFVAVAVVFNPVLPIELSRMMFLGTATLAMALFLLSVVTFRQHPRLSMASITDRTPGSESL